MKLQAEYNNVKDRISHLDQTQIITYRDKLRQSGEYKNFEIRFAWDLIRVAMGTNTICQWYKEYECNDSHITTLAIRVCKDLKLL